VLVGSVIPLSHSSDGVEPWLEDERTVLLMQDGRARVDLEESTIVGGPILEQVVEGVEVRGCSVEKVATAIDDGVKVPGRLTEGNEMLARLGGEAKSTRRGGCVETQEEHVTLLEKHLRDSCREG